MTLRCDLCRAPLGLPSYSRLRLGRHWILCLACWEQTREGLTVGDLRRANDSTTTTTGE